MEAHIKMMSGDILTIEYQPSDTIETIYEKVFCALPEDIRSEELDDGILNLQLFDLESERISDRNCLEAIKGGKPIGLIIRDSDISLYVGIGNHDEQSLRNLYVDCEGRIYHRIYITVTIKHQRARRKQRWTPEVYFYKEDGQIYFVSCYDNHLCFDLQHSDYSVYMEDNDTIMHFLVRQPESCSTPHETDLIRHLDTRDFRYTSNFDSNEYAYISYYLRRDFEKWYPTYQPRDENMKIYHEYFHGPNEERRELRRKQTKESQDEWRRLYTEKYKTEGHRDH